MREGLPDQRLDRLVVGDIAVLVEQAVLTMAGERIQRDIGDHAERRELRLECPHGTLHETVLAPRLARVVRLCVVRRDRKQRHRRYAEGHQLLGFAQQHVDSQAFDVGHRSDRFAHRAAFTDEQRLDQIVDGEPVLAHQAPRERVASHATHSGGGEAARQRTWCAHSVVFPAARGARSTIASGWRAQRSPVTAPHPAG